MEDKVGQEVEQGMPQEELDPKEKAEVEAYVSGLSKLLHGKETKSQVYEMLKSGQPEKTIPATALQINEQMEGAFKNKGHKPSMTTLVASAQFLVTDLIEIGNAGGFFQINPEDANVIGPILTNTMQPYIEKGLADGSIDPVELQALIEPMMSDEAKSEGLRVAGEQGMSATPGVSQAMGTNSKQAVLKDRKMREGEARKVAPQGGGVLNGK